MPRGLWCLTLSVVFFTATSSVAAPMVREGAVVHVDDGDTIEVRIGDRVERVRYIGMDAPEVAHEGVGGMRGGDAAARLNQALVASRRVRLELDREERDRYGRLLAYVWVDDAMINLEIVRRGYAHALTIPPNVRYARWFVAVEREARAAGRGLWGSGDLDDRATAPTPAITRVPSDPPVRRWARGHRAPDSSIVRGPPIAPRSTGRPRCPIHRSAVHAARSAGGR